MLFVTTLLAPGIAAASVAANPVSAAAVAPHAPPAANTTAGGLSYCNGDFAAANAEDLRAVTDRCSCISGNLVLLGWSDWECNLGGLVRVGGVVDMAGAHGAERFTAAALESVGGLRLRNLVALMEVLLPVLVRADVFELLVLPVLATLNMAAGLSQVLSVVVSDTALESFKLVRAESVGRLDINNNRFLETIHLPVQEVTKELVVAANGQLVVLLLPELVWTHNATVRDVGAVAIPKLAEVDHLVAFLHNHFRHLAVPLLQQVGGTLLVSSNDKLEQADFPKLQQVGGGLVVVDNPALAAVDGFAALGVVGGAVQLKGSMHTVDMGRLRLVRGSAHVASDGALDCAKWTGGGMKLVVRGGTIECSSGGGGHKSVVRPNRTRSLGGHESSGVYESGGVYRGGASGGCLSLLAFAVAVAVSITMA